MARSMSRGRPSSQAVSIRPQSSMWRTVKGFWPYLWPEDRADLRMRIIMATGLLIAAKLVTIAVPTRSNGQPMRSRPQRLPRWIKPIFSSAFPLL